MDEIISIKNNYSKGKSIEIVKQCFDLLRNGQLNDEKRIQEVYEFAKSALRDDAGAFLESKRYGGALEYLLLQLTIMLKSDSEESCKNMLKFIGVVCEMATNEYISYGDMNMDLFGGESQKDKKMIMLEGSIKCYSHAAEFYALAKMIGITPTYPEYSGKDADSAINMKLREAALLYANLAGINSPENYVGRVIEGKTLLVEGQIKRWMEVINRLQIK